MSSENCDCPSCNEYFLRDGDNDVFYESKTSGIKLTEEEFLHRKAFMILDNYTNYIDDQYCQKYNSNLYYKDITNIKLINNCIAYLLTIAKNNYYTDDALIILNELYQLLNINSSEIKFNKRVIELIKYLNRNQFDYKTVYDICMIIRELLTSLTL